MQWDKTKKRADRKHYLESLSDHSKRSVDVPPLAPTSIFFGTAMLVPELELLVCAVRCVTRANPSLFLFVSAKELAVDMLEIVEVEAPFDDVFFNRIENTEGENGFLSSSLLFPHSLLLWWDKLDLKRRYRSLKELSPKAKPQWWHTISYIVKMWVMSTHESMFLSVGFL